MNISNPPCLDTSWMIEASSTMPDTGDAVTSGILNDQGLALMNGLHRLFGDRQLVPCQPCANATSMMSASGGLGTESMAPGCIQLYPTEVIAYSEPDGLRYWALLLLLFPAVTLFGNVLVCVSVLVERSLHTVTNYFIVSLAVADIMVALLVMPLAVYVEVNNTKWQLGDALCDTWVAFDVMCCTASILNLTAISIDRFVAVTSPIRYNKHKNSTGVYAVLVALTWIISVAISSPIALGENYTKRRQDTPDVCTFYNSDFLIYSSMGSFYIPCVVMLALYWKMFRSIRQMAQRSMKRRQSCFEPTELDPNRSRLSPRRSPYSSLTGSRREIVDDQFRTSTRNRNGSDVGADVMVSLLSPSGGGACNLSVDDGNLNEAASRRFVLSLDLDASQQVDESRFDPKTTLEFGKNGGRSNKGLRPPSPVHMEVDDDVHISQELDHDSGLSIGFSRHMSTGSNNDDRKRSLSVVIDEHISADEFNMYQPRLSTNSFEMSPVNLLPTRSRLIGEDADETGNTGGGRRRLPVVLFDVGDVQTTVLRPCTEEDVLQQQQESDHGHLAADEDNENDGQRRWSTGSGRPPGEHLLRTARRSISKFNDYLSSRLPVVGGLMYGRRDRSATKRERKATKTLAIVLAVFLICWVPFFTVNIVNAVCIRYEACDDEQTGNYRAMMLSDVQARRLSQGQGQTRGGNCSTSVCQVDPLLLSCFVWLGYINSALNPVIYTIFNVEFRQVFKRLLSHRPSVTLPS